MMNRMRIGSDVVVLPTSGSDCFRRRKYVQSHNHRLEFLQIGGADDSASAGIVGHHIRIVLLGELFVECRVA